MEFKSTYGNLSYSLTGNQSHPTLMFLHGVAMDQTAFARNVKGLSASYQVLTVDLPGHGQSYVPEVFTYHEVASALVELIDHLNLEFVHIAGVSLGGHIAQYIAFHYETRVKSVIDIGSLGLHEPLPSMFKIAMAPALHVAKLTPKKMFYKMFAHDKALKASNRENLKKTASFTGKKRIITYSFAMLKEAKNPLLHPVKQPTLILHGEKDLKFLIKAGNRWHAAVNHTERHMIKDAAHVATGDQVEQVNTHIDRFIQKHLS